MGGIAGLFYPAMPRAVDPARVRAMTDALAHRGLDGEGVWCAPGVGLGHRRLSAVDVAGPSQPMASADGQVAASHDGTIGNAAELRAELAAKGARFRTRGDAEVLVEGWRAWGPAMLARLHGTFAFALFDMGAQSLFLARDRLGVKPLHYAGLPDGALAFASELKGLFAHPLLRRAPDLGAVEDYLALGYIPDDACLVAGVRKLPAGCALLVERGKPVPPPSRWWDVDFSRRDERAPAVLADELAGRLRVAVRSHMAADVPVGALLTDGVNSSAVVALMAEACPRAVRTFTVGVEGHGSDERGAAALVARRFATEHHERVLAGNDHALADRLARAFDEPFADPSALAVWQVYEAARGHVTVVLTGDGGDQAFAGDRRYRAHVAEERARALMPPFLRRAAGRLGARYPDADWVPSPLRAKTALLALAADGAEAYARAVGVTMPRMRARLFSADARRALAGYRAEDRWAAAMREAPARDALDRAQYADLKLRLPGDVLARADRMGMAVGLEVREPLLDHRLVEFAATLPPTLRLRRGEGKWLMKKAMGPYLPAAVLRGAKQGFGMPIIASFRGALAGEAAALARSRTLEGTGWFDMGEVGRLVEAHRSGRADHGRTLWQFAMLERSLEVVFG